MFKKDEFIFYGSNGVCKVEDVGPINSAVMPEDRLYYTLLPQYEKGSRIFTPVDNQKVIMRSLLTREEALELVDEIKDIDSLWILDERKRELEYKKAFGKCDCRELVKVIKAIDQRKKSREAMGKKVTVGDERYFHLAEARLYEELAIALDMDKEEAKQFVISRAQELDVDWQQAGAFVNA